MVCARFSTLKLLYVTSSSVGLNTRALFGLQACWEDVAVVFHVAVPPFDCSPLTQVYFYSTLLSQVEVALTTHWLQTTQKTSHLYLDSFISTLPPWPLCPLVQPLNYLSPSFPQAMDEWDSSCLSVFTLCVCICVCESHNIPPLLSPPSPFSIKQNQNYLFS